MVDYCCNNGHPFQHPAKKTVNTYNHATIGNSVLTESLEFYVCPFCGIKEFGVEEPEATIEDMYVADLVSGENPEITKRLKDGWVVSGKFAKQWHLEKPKVTQP